MTIRVLQCNLARRKIAMDMLYKNAEEGKIDLAIVAEPNKNAVGGGRWLTDTRRDVGMMIFNQQTRTGRTSTITNGFVWMEVEDIVVYGCYVSPNIDLEEYGEYLWRLGDSLKRHRRRTIVAGDFNAKNPAWGGTMSDHRGAILADFISAHALVVHNDGLSPTFIRGAAETFIDLTLTTEDMAGSIQEWRTTETENFSDYHLDINFQMITNRSTTNTRCDHLKMEQIDVNSFKTNLGQQLEKIDTKKVEE